MRVARLEVALSDLLGSAKPDRTIGKPFIGPELRPDLRRSALSNEQDMASDQRRRGSAPPKRLYDTKASNI